jgi:rhodanese-related sulfurtransferase
MKWITPLVVVAALSAASCGGGGESAESSGTEPAAETQTAQEGLVRVSPDTAAATIENPPDGLVILDVRTPEEFAEGHIDEAIMIDFYSDEFADQLAGLDPDVPYVLYCRSGNRSGQTLAFMEQLGFTSVQDVDGGVLAWQEAGLPLVSG